MRPLPLPGRVRDDPERLREGAFPVLLRLGVPVALPVARERLARCLRTGALVRDVLASRFRVAAPLPSVVDLVSLAAVLVPPSVAPAARCLAARAPRDSSPV